MTTSLVEPSRQVRAHFAQVIERDRPTIITRNGHEIAAVIPIADLRRYQDLSSREQNRLVAEWRHELYLPRHSFAEELGYMEEMDEAVNE